MKEKNDCDLGGDSRHCEDCVYFPDYEYNKKTGECEIKNKEGLI